MYVSGHLEFQWVFVGAVAFLTGGGGCRAVACGRRVLLLRLRLGGHAAWDAAQSQGGKCRSTGLPLGPLGPLGALWILRWGKFMEVSHGEWIGRFQSFPKLAGGKVRLRDFSEI